MYIHSYGNRCVCTHERFARQSQSTNTKAHQYHIQYTIRYNTHTHTHTHTHRTLHTQSLAYLSFYYFDHVGLNTHTRTHTHLNAKFDCRDTVHMYYRRIPGYRTSCNSTANHANCPRTQPPIARSAIELPNILNS